MCSTSRRVGGKTLFIFVAAVSIFVLWVLYRHQSATSVSDHPAARYTAGQLVRVVLDGRKAQVEDSGYWNGYDWNYKILVVASNPHGGTGYRELSVYEYQIEPVTPVYKK